MSKPDEKTLIPDHKPRRSHDKELATFAKILTLVAELTPDGQNRLIDYLSGRLNQTLRDPNEGQS